MITLFDDETKIFEPETTKSVEEVVDEYNRDMELLIEQTLKVFISKLKIVSVELGIPDEDVQTMIDDTECTLRHQFILAFKKQ